MKDKTSSVIVRVVDNNCTRGGHILHEQKYNTGHGVSAIPDEIRREIRRQPGQPEIQQKPVVYLLLEETLGRDTRVIGLPVPAAPQPSQPAHAGRTEADPGYALQESTAGHSGVVAPAAAAGLYPPAGKPVPGNEKTWDVPTARKETSLHAQPYQQMTHPGQRIQVDVKVVPRRCITDPELRLYQYTAIDEFTRLRFLVAYPEQSTFSSADFLKKLVKWYARRGIRVECVQTDNGFEFTNRFSNSRRDLPTLFQATAAQLGIRHKLIRPYTPRHNGKVERSHREDQKRFYSCHSFYSLDDFAK